MLSPILQHIQTQKFRLRRLAALGQAELRVHEPDIEPAPPGERLENVGTLEREIHAPPEGEVLEDGDELRGVVMGVGGVVVVILDDLEARGEGFDVFVEGDDHAVAGDGEGCCGATGRGGG